MKIVLITGSPRKNGTSNYLADHFMQGAIGAGHEVYRVDAAFADVHPCIGCETCKEGKSECVFKDDMLKIYPKIKEADLIAYATPLYYHAATPQLLTVISRLHGINDQIWQAPKKAVLLSTGANPNPFFFHGLKEWFMTDLKYLGWEEAGSLFVEGVYAREDIEKQMQVKRHMNWAGI